MAVEALGYLYENAEYKITHFDADDRTRAFDTLTISFPPNGGEIKLYSWNGFDELLDVLNEDKQTEEVSEVEGESTTDTGRS